MPNLFGGRSVVLLYSEEFSLELKLPERIRRTSERRAPVEIAGMRPPKPAMRLSHFAAGG